MPYEVEGSGPQTWEVALNDERLQFSHSRDRHKTRLGGLSRFKLSKKLAVFCSSTHSTSGGSSNMARNAPTTRPFSLVNPGEKTTLLTLYNRIIYCSSPGLRCLIVLQAAVHGIVCSRRLQNGLIVQKNVAQRFSLSPLGLSDM